LDPVLSVPPASLRDPLADPFCDDSVVDQLSQLPEFSDDVVVDLPDTVPADNYVPRRSSRLRTHSAPHAVSTHVSIPSVSVSIDLVRAPHAYDRYAAHHDKNDVMLAPAVFAFFCHKLGNVSPDVDLFASTEHHQLVPFVSATFEPDAFAVDAFSLEWSNFKLPYINPPWCDIPRILEVLSHTPGRAMMIVPEWPFVSWWDQFMTMVVLKVVYTKPLYLSRFGNMRPKPTWNTVAAIVENSFQ
jgi:hypothetical protein